MPLFFSFIQRQNWLSAAFYLAQEQTIIRILVEYAQKNPNFGFILTCVGCSCVLALNVSLPEGKAVLE